MWLRCLFVLLLTVPGVAIAADGAALYTQRCALCYLVTGEDITGRAPPLTGMEAWLAMAEGRSYISCVVLHGLSGPIVGRGQSYNALMLGFHWRMQDDDLVTLLRYVAETLNRPAKGYEPITLDVLSAARAAPGRDTDGLALRAKLPER